MDDLISIIIPIYNAGEYLDFCLKSVQDQTYHHLEVILVDDGSSDNSAKICRKYAENDSRFLYFYQKNAGVSTARNMGLARATGKYLSFVDSDDWLSPVFIDHLYHNILKYHSDISACNYQEVKGKKTIPHYLSNDEKVVSSTEALAVLFPITITLWKLLIRREYLINLTFDPQYSIGEDGLFLMELLKKELLVSFLPESLYFYRVNDKSAMQQKFTPRFMTILYTAENYYQSIVTNHPDYKAVADYRLIVSAKRILARLSSLNFHEYKKNRYYKNEIFNILDQYVVLKKKNPYISYKINCFLIFYKYFSYISYFATHYGLIVKNFISREDL